MLLLHAFFFFNTPPTTDIYTLSLHDALPIYRLSASTSTEPSFVSLRLEFIPDTCVFISQPRSNRSTLLARRSEEHTSELQSPYDLVCRLLLEKKKKIKKKSKT